MKKPVGKSDVYDYETRFGRADTFGADESVLGTSRRGGSAVSRVRTDSVARLDYYRSHGLDRCDDYPGGDVQFESDVLSGTARHEDFAAMGPLGAEDAYIIGRMHDGRFRYDSKFRWFPMRPEVMLAFRETMGSRGIHSTYSVPLDVLRKDVLSGEFARQKRIERGF